MSQKKQSSFSIWNVNTWKGGVVRRKKKALHNIYSQTKLDQIYKRKIPLRSQEMPSARKESKKEWKKKRKEAGHDSLPSWDDYPRLSSPMNPFSAGTRCQAVIVAREKDQPRSSFRKESGNCPRGGAAIVTLQPPGYQMRSRLWNEKGFFLSF